MTIMTQDNSKDDISDALTEFNKDASTSICLMLDCYLTGVAKTGETLFPWHRICKLFRTKLDKTICEFSREFNMDGLPPSPNVENATFDVIRQRILEQLDSFGGAPFTIQRLCEMVTNPRCHYKRTDKFLRAIEKNVNVVTTVDPFGKKIVCDPKPIMNGMESDPNTPALTPPPNLPPTYSSAPWAAAPRSPSSTTVWPPPPPATPSGDTLPTSATNGLDSTTDKQCENNEEESESTATIVSSTDTTNSTSQSETPMHTDTTISESHQSETNLSTTTQNDDSEQTNCPLPSSDDVTCQSEADKTGANTECELSSPPVLVSAATDQHTASRLLVEEDCCVAIVTDSQSSSSSASSLSPTVPVARSAATSISQTMEATEPQLPASRPGKRESENEDDGLVSPAKRMCLEKDGLTNAEAKASDPVTKDKAEKETNGKESTNDVTSTAEVTNGDHVAEAEATKKQTPAANQSKEAETKEETAEGTANQSEDSNDSEALTSSSEESAEPAAADVTEQPQTDDVTAADDDVSKEDGGGEADSAEDTSNQ